MTRVSQWSIRTFLIWLALACLLPGVIAAGGLVLYQYRQSLIQLENATQHTARALVQTVDSHLLKSQAVTLALSTRDSLASGDFARFHREAREVIRLATLGSNVVLRDEAGRQLLNTAVEFGSPLPPQGAPEQVRGVFASAKPTVSNLFIGPVIKRPVMSVDVPVILEGKVAYALGMGISPERFNAILQSQSLPAGWVAAILDGSGTVVGRNLVPEKFVGKKATSHLLGAMEESLEGSLESTTLDGTPVLTSYSRSPLTDWRVAIGIPRQTLEAALERTLGMIAAALLVLFGIGLLLARVMGAKIADSVEALTVPAEALGKGAPVSVPPVQIKETAAVAQALQRADELLQERALAIEATQAELAEAHRLAKFGTWSWNLLTHEVKTSKSIVQIYGREVPAFPQQRGTLLTVESWERVNAAAQAVMQNGQGYELELQVNHGQGHTIWIQSKCETVRNENGEVVALRGAVQDITERKYADERQRIAEQAAWRSQQLLKTTMDNFPTVIAFKDKDGHFIDVNGAVEQALGIPKDQILGHTMYDFIPQEAADVLRGHEVEVMRARQATQAEKTTPLESGTLYHLDTSFPLIDAQGEVYGTGHVSHDITDRKRAEQRLRDAALHDSLTGLPNRAFLIEYGGRLIASAQRGRAGGALLFIDLDRFKPINDLHGHETGDRVLKEVGQRLVACTRQEDLVGRLGGDEFVIVLSHLESGPHQGALIAQHVLDTMSQPFCIGALELSVTPSIGISFFPEHASDVATLIHTADLAMYQAKQSGRANFQLYTPELDRRAEQTHSIEARLRHALKQGRMELHYQPVIDIESGRLIGAEALLRLLDHKGAAVGPASFIPIAESAGLIGELGEWAATEACRQQAAWLAEGLRITMAINVSPLQFRQRWFAEKLSGIISSTGIDPTFLEIEVTESTVMQNVDDAVEVLKKIKSLGARIALDDFGTGYSSLSRLTSLPLDKLKVDQSFVRRIERDQASRAVTETILALGHSLRLDVVGEGIETVQTLRYLYEHGCQQAQGFWFSKPLPALEFVQWSRNRAGQKTAGTPQLL